MATIPSPRAGRVRQTRKSIAHLPSTDPSGDKENATLDLAALPSLDLQSKEKVKKSRSKSIGPGGLDALKQGNGNKTPPRQVRSILKTTIPLSPPKNIPPRNGSQLFSPIKGSGKRTPDKSTKPSPSRASPSKASTQPGSASGRSPSSASRSPTRVAVRTEEEQEQAARERARKEEADRKEARRKSLALRRVSFAPEATLHTWNVVEMPEDSTTSSASTNSTRRGSPYTTPRSPMPSSDASEPPSTPEQVEELQVSASPAHQRDLHQKKRRRSSTVPPVNFNDPNEFSSSPASAQSDDTGIQGFETADEGVDESSDSADDEDIEEEDETVRSADADDTIQSNGKNSTSSSGRLEAALEQAAKQAGTQGIEYDEHGDITMEMADDEVTNAFQPFVKQKNQMPQAVNHLKASLDQENINPFSPAFKANIGRADEPQDDTATMDMTQAVGGILSKPEELHSSPKKRKARKSVMGGRRRSSVARRRSSGDASNMDGDETMDLTTAIGGIESGPTETQDTDAVDEDEDEELTMEFTSVVGGVVQPETKTAKQLSSGANTESTDVTLNEADMDMTFAAGGILPPISEVTEPLEDATMDVTTAIGNILPAQLSAGNKVEAKHLMELETDAGQLTDSPFQRRTPQKPMGAGLADERPLPTQLHKTAVASETGSPSMLTLQTRSAGRKSLAPCPPVSPKNVGKSNTPVKKLNTPSKQLTPQPTRPITPGKTPPSKNVTMRTSSPKKLFTSEIKAGNSAKKTDDTPNSSFHNPLFRKDTITGVTTPSVILQPKRRRSSGLGLDREGLGSPQVTEKLDRRASIGDTAKTFVARERGAENVRFEDPHIMEQEIDQSRAEDQRRESNRLIMEAEADDQNADDDNITANLKDMINSLTPQRNKLKGRKSLHVGAAKGLLGKRPAELDEDEDSDATPKRLKGREGSPVKKVRLPAPPPKSATTGRITRSSKLSLAETTGNARSSTPVGSTSPSKENTTPKDQPRFRNAETQSPTKVQPFEQKLQGQVDTAEPLEGEDRIHLQDFLNMTSIRFMELTTTKRRHTVAPNAAREASARKADRASGDFDEVDGKLTLESCVTAGACTVPMLELYQHSCRELKKYISEGRDIVKEIEADTYEDNPLLFREYLSAPADVRLIMDNQFKNVKTNARLLSKAMWYEWRMKLLDGLKEGLIKIGDDMEQDDQCLTQQEQIIQPVLPGLIEEHDRLEIQVQIAQAQADELAGCDQDELRYARETLDSLDQDLEAKQKLVEELQNELREKEDGLETAVARKEECNNEIKEAERILQDCRGWSASEVSALQANVDRLEATHGWTISAATTSTLTMTYKRTLQLYFTPTPFLPTSSTPEEESNTTKENAPISLTYIADATTPRPQPLTTEKRFFLQIIRAHLQCLHQPSTTIPTLLSFISSSWTSASTIADEIKALNASYITEASITSDDIMAVDCSVLLTPMRTRVVVSFEVRVGAIKKEGLKVAIKASTRVVYGESLKEGKMGEFVQGRMQQQGGWVDAVKELEAKCLARGKK